MAAIDERGALLVALNDQRDHVLGILEGLGEEELRRVVLPSGWTCLGLVRHLALDVERFWFRCVVAGEQVELPEGAAAWHVGEDMTLAAVFGLYRDEVGRANEIIASTDLDRAPANSSEDWGSEQKASLREVVVHVITETACHAGQLDVVRELIDGRRWLVLD